MDQPLRVLVSAGASGIGASIAERFRAYGAKVSNPTVMRPPFASRPTRSGPHHLVRAASL